MAILSLVSASNCARGAASIARPPDADEPPVAAADGGDTPRSATTIANGATDAAAAPSGEDASGSKAVAKPTDGVVTLTPTVTATTVLAPFAASGSLNVDLTAPIQIPGFHGTDLGITFVHQTNLRVLFGDTWADDQADPVGLWNDDVEGHISLLDFPSGQKVEDYVQAHPPAPGQLPWQAGGPPIEYQVRWNGRVAPIRLERDNTLISTSLGRTPVAGFSNGSDVFVMFHRWVPVQCSGGTDPSCPEGYTCDPGLGTLLGPPAELAFPCVLSDAGCRAVPSGGLCQDRTSAMYNVENWGRTQSVVLQDDIGNLDRNNPDRYLTRTILTHKFRSVAVRTVSDFDPSRARGEGNVYTTPTTAGPQPSQKVFFWGRPSFGGSQARGTNARLYFMYMDMPEYSPTGEMALSPQYFMGLKDGVPRFSNSPIDAKPLDLSYPGPDPARERWDIVNQMSVSWVAPIKKWVMLYGGDLSDDILDVIVGPDPSTEHDPEGAIHIRFADQPWGPWSAPEAVLKTVPGPDGAAAIPSAAGGIVHMPECKRSDCPPSEAFYGPDSHGFLYAPNIIDVWTEERAAGKSADIYWNVSTWNPYQVVLLKSRIELQ